MTSGHALGRIQRCAPGFFLTPASTFQLYTICVLIWGSTWIAVTFQLGEVAPEMSVGYRFLLAAVALFGYCRWRGLPLTFRLGQHLDFAVLGAFMFCIGHILVYYAETHVVSGLVAVGFSVTSMINMLAARVCLGTPMSKSVAVAALFGVAGIACIFWPEFGKFSASRNAVWGRVADHAVSTVLFGGEHGRPAQPEAGLLDLE